MATVSINIGLDVLKNPKGHSIWYYQNMFGGENISLCASASEAHATMTSKHEALTLLWDKEEGLTDQGKLMLQDRAEGYYQSDD